MFRGFVSDGIGIGVDVGLVGLVFGESVLFEKGFESWKSRGGGGGGGDKSSVSGSSGSRTYRSESAGREFEISEVRRYA